MPRGQELGVHLGTGTHWGEQALALRNDESTCLETQVLALRNADSKVGRTSARFTKCRLRIPQTATATSRSFRRPTFIGVLGFSHSATLTKWSKEGTFLYHDLYAVWYLRTMRPARLGYRTVFVSLRGDHGTESTHTHLMLIRFPPTPPSAPCSGCPHLLPWTAVASS